MAKTRQVGPESVVWISPEAMGASADEVRAAIEDGADAEQIVEMTRPAAFGEYREFLGDEITEGNLIRPKYGDRLVWVDDAPGDDQDGSGHWETFEAERHGWGGGGEYRPTLKATQVGTDKEARTLRGVS